MYKLCIEFVNFFLLQAEDERKKAAILQLQRQMQAQPQVQSQSVPSVTSTAFIPTLANMKQPLGQGYTVSSPDPISLGFPQQHTSGIMYNQVTYHLILFNIRLI